MSEEQERRPTGARPQVGAPTLSRDTRRTERLDVMTNTPAWRQRERTTGVGGAGTKASTVWQTLPRWIQKGGFLYLIILGVLGVAVFVLLMIWLRGDRRETPLTSPTLPAIVSQSSDEQTAPLTSESAPPQPEPTLAPRFYIVVNTQGQGLFLRPQPNRNNPPLATLPEGTRLEQIGDDVPGADYVWRPVRTPDGLEGYVAVDFLNPAP